MRRQERTATGIGGKLALHPRKSNHGRQEIQPAQHQGLHIKHLQNTGAPTLVPCLLRTPDGTTRPGWELRLGEILFGRADSQEVLLQYYARLHEPMPSGHWRERVWQPNPPRSFARLSRADEMDEAGELLEGLEEEL